MNPFYRLHTLFWRNPKWVAKAIETRLLGRYSWTYSYNYPDHLQIEVTNKCNLRCTMCPRLDEIERGEIEDKDMAFETFASLIDQTKDIVWLYLTGRGEPLMNRAIFRMIEYAARKGIPGIALSTNGTLLAGSMIDRLRRTRLTYLGVSIDSADTKTFGKIRNYDLGKILRNVKKFSQHSNIPILVTTVLTKDNIDTITEMPALVREVGANVLRVISLAAYDIPGMDSLTFFDLDEPAYQLLRKRLWQKCKEYRVKLLMLSRFYNNTCYAPFLSGYIDVRGRLTPCCVLPGVKLGDVMKLGFWKAWNNQRMHRWRRMVATKNFPRACVKSGCSMILGHIAQKCVKL